MYSWKRENAQLLNLKSVCPFRNRIFSYQGNGIRMLCRNKTRLKGLISLHFDDFVSFMKRTVKIIRANYTRMLFLWSEGSFICLNEILYPILIIDFAERRIESERADGRSFLGQTPGRGMIETFTTQKTSSISLKKTC